MSSCSYTIDQLQRDILSRGVRGRWSCEFCEEKSEIMFGLIDWQLHPRLFCQVRSDMSLTIESRDFLQKKIYRSNIDSYETIHHDLMHLAKLGICTGMGLEKARRSPECKIILDQKDIPRNNHGDQRCFQCAADRRREMDKGYKQKKRKREKEAKDIYTARELKRTKIEYENLEKAYQKLQEKLELERQALSASTDRAIADAVQCLPEAQQLAVRACIAASRVSDPRQNRYNVDWIYHCILLRIKNKGLYEHMRRMKILALPCPDTLNNYLKNLECGYGFQKSLFECLKQKTIDIPVPERRGCLLIDEMKLSENISFDANTMAFKGFTDLGNHTPENRKRQVGDHALVVMFQPFRGSWVQTVGCFLSKGSASGFTLHKLILEAVALVEGAGLCVDVITTDGASWNRAMWKKFCEEEGGNTSKNNEKKEGKIEVSCTHPLDDKRRLWFMSDFPHLIKTLRNWLVKQRRFKTPDGIVDIQHWRTILLHEPPDNARMRTAPALSPAHLNPRGFQKMNVPMAFQLFSPRVQAAMKLFSPNTSHASIQFCFRINNLIEAMMSRYTRQKTLRKTGPHREDWEDENKTMQPQSLPLHPKCLTSETLLGLKVTLRATLELFDYLSESHGYNYLMTSRLNQDALERFFGLIRSSCGCNDHPNAVQFAQMYRLLCVYSLTKPAKNSNVSGGEILHTLMNFKNISSTLTGSEKQRWLEALDAVLDSVEYVDCGENSAEHELDGIHDCSEAPSLEQPQLDHDYTVTNTSDFVQSYVAGYISRKFSRYTKCSACINSLKSSQPQGRDKLIQELSYGYLLYPSIKLFQLTEVIEKIILDVMANSEVELNTLLIINEKVIEVIQTLPTVGGREHYKDMTKQVISFYLVTRGHFLATYFNNKNLAKKEKAKLHRKCTRQS